MQNKGEPFMKKTVSLLMILLMVLGLVAPCGALAAEKYPEITLKEAESSRTIVEGEKGQLVLQISPRYRTEKYVIQFYTSAGKHVATAENELSNTSTMKKTVVVSVDTAMLQLQADVYSVVYYMEYYASGEWHEAPERFAYSFRVIASECEEHDYVQGDVIKAATCAAEGSAWFKCSLCGNECVQTLSRGEHRYDKTLLNKPTQFVDGKYEYVCEGCGDTYTQVIPSTAAVKIVAQPENAAASMDEVATFTVQATGEGLSYQWYYKNAGSDSWKVASGTGNTYSLKNTVERNGRSFYCIVTDAFGNTEKTDTVIMQAPAIQITKQPKDDKAFADEKVKISVKAKGEGLIYQWYYKSPEDAEWKKASGTGTSYSLTMTEARDGRLMKCVITDVFGNSVETKVVTLSLAQTAKIVKQPKSAKAFEGEQAVTTIEATGDGLTYQWYYKNPGSTKFKKSSITTAECAVTMTADRDGREMYCIVTDEYGNEVKSKTVTLSLAHAATITKQPKNAWANEGEKAKISVTATGDELTYQWYYKSPEAEEWTVASGTAASYSLTMTEARDGRLMKCVVTDAYGNSVETKVVTLTTRYPATITKQPKSAKAFEGEQAVTTIEATGEGLTYQWYYKNPGSSSYKKSSITTAECAVEMTEARDGRKMYCIVTDAYGNEVKSKTITLSIAKTAQITAQPKSVSIAKDKTAKFTVEATGDGLTYQWYYKDKDDTEFKKASGTEATYSTKATKARNGRTFYCEITDAYGNVVKTKTVKLTVK